MTHLLSCHDIVKTDFVRAENCYLYDAQGRRYVDFESGIWCTALGHSQPRITQTMTEQLAQVMHLGTRYPNAQTETAARAVLDLVGLPSGRATFLSSGSEAVEFGAQALRRVTGRPLLLTFANSYLAAYGSAGGKQRAEWWLCDWQVEGDGLDAIPFDQIGGFVFEPGGSGSGFVRFPPAPLVQAIVERVRAAGGWVMANEITTGMGRTGRWFGYQHYDLQPDVVALGKGLGNGYPVSAVALRSEIAMTLEQSSFRYAQSHQNDPLGCAVAQTVITLLREGAWIERGAALGASFLAGLQCLTRYPIVKEARGRGMLLALELHPHPTFTVAAAYHALLERGFLVGYYPAGNVLRFDPALTIAEDDIAQLLETLTEMLAAVQM